MVMIVVRINMARIITRIIPTDLSVPMQCFYLCTDKHEVYPYDGSDRVVGTNLVFVRTKFLFVYLCTDKHEVYPYGVMIES